MRHNDTLKTVQGHKTIRWLRTSLAKFSKMYRTHDVRHDVRHGMSRHIHTNNQRISSESITEEEQTKTSLKSREQEQNET